MSTMHMKWLMWRKAINKMIKLYLRGDKVERAAGLQRNEVRLWFWIVVKVKYVFFFWKRKEIDSNKLFLYNWYMDNCLLWSQLALGCCVKINFTVVTRITCWGIKANWIKLCYYYILLHCVMRYWVPTQFAPRNAVIPVYTVLHYK